ncbi:MAG: hypothetical protein J6A56_01885 [Clostridia bacterium]|nr:hypothetical protein [Clostridia bacterium]
MAEYYHGKTEKSQKSPRSPRVVRLFFKQTFAALVCGLLVFLMHTLPIPYLNNCADALGRALRYELKLPTEGLTEWVKERITEH